MEYIRTQTNIFFDTVTYDHNILIVKVSSRRSHDLSVYLQLLQLLSNLSNLFFSFTCTTMKRISFED